MNALLLTGFEGPHMPYCLIWAVNAGKPRLVQVLLLSCMVSLDGTHLCDQLVKGSLLCAKERKGQASSYETLLSSQTPESNYTRGNEQ